jgi:hypothetical protein
VTERVELYCDPDDVNDSPANAGLREVAPLVRALQEAGMDYAVVDVSGHTREQLQDEYLRLAMRPAVTRRYRVRQIFGTHKYPGSWFGKGVPALVVLEDGNPRDVYPHEEEGRIVTIADYVSRIGRGDEAARRRALVRRMDALRKRIGPVGVSMRELIEDGRRR